MMDMADTQGKAQTLQSRGFAVSLVDALMGIIGALSHAAFWVIGFRGLWFFGRCAGTLVFSLKGHKRRKVIEAAQEFLSLDGPEARAVALKSFKNHYMRHFETFFFGSLDADSIKKIASIQGMENLDVALKRNKGAILLLSHFGSFLLPLPYLGFKGYRVGQLTGRQIHRSLLNERFWLWRKKEADKLPVRFIQAGKFMRPLYEALKSNESVAIAFDGKDGARFVQVGFFNREVRFSTGPFELARKTGATIIPTFVVRQADNTHAITLERPFELSPGSGEAAVQADTRAFAKILEGYVKKEPCHFGLILPKLEKVN